MIPPPDRPNLELHVNEEAEESPEFEMPSFDEVLEELTESGD